MYGRGDEMNRGEWCHINGVVLHTLILTWIGASISLDGFTWHVASSVWVSSKMYGERSAKRGDDLVEEVFEEFNCV